MTRDELMKRLKGYEWNDIEFKKAQHGVSESAYETVSAFSNTEGGWLVFGVKDDHGEFEAIGVIEVDKVQNDFFSVLRSGDKLNRVIRAEGEIIDHENRTLLIFYIPEVQRHEKPIYLNGDIRRSYIRRGGCDEKCTPSEIERFIRDASGRRYDGEIIEDLDPENCFDEDAVKWYRTVFNDKNPGRSEALSDVEFLNEWGFIIESEGKLVPTRAAILVFGNGRAVRQILPRPIVDYYWIEADFDDWSPDKRWADRLVIEENLIQSWRKLVSRYMSHAERPFSIDSATLRRSDDPSDYISFREAVINLLIHQDFGDHTRKPVVKFFRNRVVFWNPGDAFVSMEELLEPTEKEVRNPSIVSAFRRIGLSDQAGTGIRSIFSNWVEFGRVPPEIKNDKTEKAFEITLLNEELRTEEQIRFEASLGVHLNEHEAKAFAYACRKGTLSLTDVKAVTGLSSSRSREIVNNLVVQVLMKPVDDTETGLYELAEHLADRFSGEFGADQAAEDTVRLVSDQPARDNDNLVTDQAFSIEPLSDTQRRIIQLCDVPRLLSDIRDEFEFTHRSYFKKKHLNPLIQGNLIRSTHPDQPNHPNQKYVLTEAGVQLKLKQLKNLSGKGKEE